MPRLLLLLALVAAGCAPSASPLYRDYAVDGPRESSTTDATQPQPTAADLNSDVRTRVREALAEAGWREAPPSAPNAVSTEPRVLNDWGLYRTEVALDVVPIAGRYVRVLFHPARRYFTGGVSKVAYLGDGVRSALVPDLNDAFMAHGLVPLGTARERDEDSTDS